MSVLFFLLRFSYYIFKYTQFSGQLHHNHSKADKYVWSVKSSYLRCGCIRKSVDLLLNWRNLHKKKDNSKDYTIKKKITTTVVLPRSWSTPASHKLPFFPDGRFFLISWKTGKQINLNKTKTKIPATRLRTTSRNNQSVSVLDRKILKRRLAENET